MSPARPPRSVAAAILGGRCPRCREGRVFSGAVRMNRACPGCGLVFEREPGYFLGAMYMSYGLAVAAAAPVVVVGLGLGWPHLLTGGVAFGVLLLLSPFIFRVSRVGWLHFDHRFDPR